MHRWALTLMVTTINPSVLCLFSVYIFSSLLWTIGLIHNSGLTISSKVNNVKKGFSLMINFFWCRDGKKKQNVKCVRFNVNGECRVLLIASRDIRKGERLYYDYNGYENEYPTEHFVWSHRISISSWINKKFWVLLTCKSIFDHTHLI